MITRLRHEMADVTRRSRAAQFLAFFALVAALVGALGPAEKRTTTYDWPPAALPSGKPSRAWYTPLLLTRHRAGAMSANVPCRLPPPLPVADGSTILATARFPERADALAVTREQNRLVVRIGDREIARTPLAAADAADEECSYRLSLAGSRWSLEGGPRALDDSGGLVAMPVVTGLFSELDLGSGDAPTIRVTTPVQGGKPRPHQQVAWVLAALAIAAALALVAFPRRPRPWRALQRGTRSALGALRIADAVVVGTLLAWWVLAPAFHDDGWVVARQRTFASSGGFASYYNAFGVHYPGQFWLEWAQHWLVESTSALIFLRAPALLCLVATWVLVRWILSRVAPASTAQRVVVWTLAAGFLVGALSWGMTLRTEPVSAFLVTAALACVVRFRERGTTAPLAALAIVLPFALTGHQAAVAAFAPFLVAAPSLLAWVRARIAEATAIVASAFALFAMLLFVGSDLEQRSADAQTLAGFTGASWRTEIHRYTSLAVFPFGTPLRRAFVALALLTVAAFLLRRSRRSQPLLDLPAASLGISLLLLIATPTKFPWHFGALIGVAAVALAAEIVRLREEYRAQPGSLAKPLVVVGAAVLAAAWAWTPRTGWSTLDLRTLDWKPGIEAWLPIATFATVLPVVVLAALALRGLLRDRETAARAPWRTASWVVPLVAVPLLVFTFAVLAADAVRTDSWTLTRQNLGALRGDAGCGLADSLLVPTVSSQEAVGAGEREARSLALWTPPAPVAGLPRFSLGPAGGVPARTPWFRVDSTRFGLYVAGVPRSSDRLELEWGRRRGSSVRSLGGQRISTAFSTQAGASLPWRFVSSGELPRAAAGANALRIALRSDAAPGAAIAVTAPVRYATEPLAAALERDDSRPLVLPNLVTYLPCVELPQLGGGIAEPPSHIVTPSDAPSPVREPDSSPFAGVLDLYELERLPLADSTSPPSEIAVFRVDREIPGALQAPPTSASTGG